jgi:hypothetical protein
MAIFDISLSQGLVRYLEFNKNVDGRTFTASAANFLSCERCYISGGIHRRFSLLGLLVR